MEYLFIYLLQFCSILDTLRGAMAIAVFVLIIFNIIIGFLTRFEFEKFEKKDYLDISTSMGQNASKFCKKAVPICAVCFILLCLIPSRQTVLLFGGMYMGKKAVKSVINDEKIKKVNTIIELELDKKIKELKGENNAV